MSVCALVACSDTSFCRLEQNRRSARKCRMKKKAEYKEIFTDINQLKAENKELKEKVSPPKC